ncbi:MAG TPA: hypothetical protein VGR35_17470 [Tepidisphaeraceae bacterium]|nr:hypothetical protein [Tepidisphaeraceae bacterium]
MTMMRSMLATTLLVILITGCSSEPQYGTERQLALPGTKRQVWAVAPAVNLSGQRVDALLQADLAYQQLQQVDGITAIPVNRVAEVYAGLQIDRISSQEQAELVCELLGADGLLIPTVTAYDPYDPPKLGASLQLFGKSAARRTKKNLDPRDLARRATPGQDESLPPAMPQQFLQVVGMFDAANGSVRKAVLNYAKGRNDPVGPYGADEYFVSMDRYSGFVYHVLIAELMNHPRLRKGA